MRKCLVWMVMLGMLFGMNACAENEIWMYACSVGKADAILVGEGNTACLIDAGYARSRGKILAAMQHMGVERLEAVFVTHCDEDHVEGLEWLAQSDIEIGAWYASAMFTEVKESKHDAVKAAEERGQEVVWLQAGDSVPLGGAALEVLGPSVLNPDKDDNNSLVMMLRSPAGRILLAGDMEFEQEQVLLQSGAELACDVLKVGNHADNDTTGEAFVRAARPSLAVISTSTAEKPDTPDPRVIGLLESVGAQVAVTQDCTGGVLARVSGGAVSLEYVNLPAADGSVIVEDVVAGEDIIALYNAGGGDADLSGWYLISEKGGEMFVLPEGTSIGAGERLTIGTKSSDGAFDIFWDEKKVVHKSKTDEITLYDRYGMAVSSMTNGH